MNIIALYSQLLLCIFVNFVVLIYACEDGNTSCDLTRSTCAQTNDGVTECLCREGYHKYPDGECKSPAEFVNSFLFELYCEFSNAAPNYIISPRNIVPIGSLLHLLSLSSATDHFSKNIVNIINPEITTPCNEICVVNKVFITHLGTLNVVENFANAYNIQSASSNNLQSDVHEFFSNWTAFDEMILDDSERIVFVGHSKFHFTLQSSLTYVDQFKKSSSESIAVDFYLYNATYSQETESGCKVIKLHLLDSTFTFMILLPDDGVSIDTVVNGLTNDKILRWGSDEFDQNAVAHFPYVEIEDCKEIREEVKSLRKYYGSETTNDPSPVQCVLLNLSNINHVSESTEERSHIILNKPFLLYIFNDNTDIIEFLARIDAPIESNVGKTVDNCDMCNHSTVICSKNNPAICQCSGNNHSIVLIDDHYECQGECVVSGENTCGDATCIENHGISYCACQEGYTIEYSDGNITCQEINECETMPDICGNAVCINIEGSYQCECDAGLTYSSEGKRCIGCSSNECPDDSTCRIVDEKLTCECKEGYKLSQDNSHCEDVNECQDDPNICPSDKPKCFNVEGSYECQEFGTYLPFVMSTLGAIVAIIVASCAAIYYCKRMEGKAVKIELPDSRVPL